MEYCGTPKITLMTLEVFENEKFGLLISKCRQNQRNILMLNILVAIGEKPVKSYIVLLHLLHNERTSSL